MRSCDLTAWRASLRYHDLPGGDPPVVFLHGLGCASSSDYPAVAGHPSLAGRRRLLVDLLGSGFSDKPETFAYTIAAHAETVIALLEAIAVPKAALFGHSMGGSVAIMVASLRPDLVTALVLSEPNLDAGGGTFSRRIALSAEEAYLAAGHANMLRDARDTGNLRWAGTLAVASARGVYRSARSLVDGVEPSWRQRLETLAMPRTVLFGALSLPDPDTDRLPARGVRVGVVPGAGHSMQWENPSGLAQAIGLALAQNRQGT